MNLKINRLENKLCLSFYFILFLKASKMSATFKLSKKKYSQNDLRKLMNQQKAKKLEQSTKIDSPLAKYDELGQLMCALCKTVVRSEDVWKVHINAKQHKQNVELARQLKEKTNNFTTATASKRPGSPTAFAIPTKIPKSILKIKTTSSTEKELTDSKANSLPVKLSHSNNTSKVENFFERTLKKTTIRSELVNIKRNNDAANFSEKHEDTAQMEIDEQLDEQLPEGFFDDPIKDAKARNLDYKDPVEEEWDRFQQEIKEAANFSNAIIAEDQEEATAARQIDEIDEQIRNWSR